MMDRLRAKKSTIDFNRYEKERGKRHKVLTNISYFPYHLDKVSNSSRRSKSTIRASALAERDFMIK